MVVVPVPRVTKVVGRGIGRLRDIVGPTGGLLSGTDLLRPGIRLGPVHPYQTGVLIEERQSREVLAIDNLHPNRSKKKGRCVDKLKSKTFIRNSRQEHGT